MGFQTILMAEYMYIFFFHTLFLDLHKLSPYFFITLISREHEKPFDPKEQIKESTKKKYSNILKSKN